MLFYTIIFIIIIFSLFVLGFELTKTTDVNSSNTVHNTNALTTSDGNNFTINCYR